MTATTVEESLELDVHLLNREDCLAEDGQAGVLQWTSDTDDHVATAGYAYIEDDGAEAVVVFYTVSPQRPDDEAREMKLLIPIERTDCHFGGTRPWFHCPECNARKAKLYKPPQDADRFLCQDCHGLLYASQTHTRPLPQALNDLDDATDDVRENGVSRETMREFYEAEKDVIETVNDQLDGLADEYGERDWRTRWEELPPFEEWVADLFRPAGMGREYGEFGQCEATAQTTGERCRQPATDDHGKCHYHGGAEGVGAPEGNQNAAD